VRIERKSLPDLLLCIGRERERFERELSRLRAFPVRAVVVEGDHMTLASGSHRAQISPESACHSIASWVARFNVPLQFCGSREQAEDFTRHMLFNTARRAFERAELFRRAKEARQGAA
jgi:ERCC4-type nuclease